MSQQWIEELRAECAKASQAAVAKRMGYAASVISQVLKGTYKGRLDQVKLAFTEQFGGQNVECPVCGTMPVTQCRKYRNELDRRTNHMRARLARVCPECPFNPDLKTQKGA